MMRRVIVVGGSAGSIQALCTLLEELPPDFSAPLLAVIHTSEESHFLPKVLQRCTDLKVISPKAAEPIRDGNVYIASPNRHLLIKSHCVVSAMGPRENRYRPAVDALFRTAARVYRSHVVAVVLSGALDDGSAGALTVKARGGTVVVQDPKEAAVQDMPANVLRRVKTDHCLPLAKISALLAELAAKGSAIKFRKPTRKQCEALSHNSMGEREPPGYTCPECGGVVMRVEDGKNAQFRCHVGHTFSLESFSEAHSDAMERALWVALRRLNEQQSLQKNLAAATSNHSLKKRHLENAHAAEHDMRLLHDILARI